MGDSDESIFWDEREDDFGGVLDFQSNQTANHQTIYDEEFGSKLISLSPDSDHQEGDGDSSSQSPLGLTLRKTPSFLNLLQRSLSRGDNKPTRKMEDSGNQSLSEKLKASNFPASFIKIGCWQRVTRHEGDLTAKVYYAKRKMVWEVLEGALKSKIEIQWSDITAIRAIMVEDESGTLEIELNQPPLFYREINPQPRKHTLWQQSSDFTGGQAPIWRRHYVRFPPGILDRHYEKLLQCDRRLFELSHKPFPSQQSPYFDPTMFGISQLSLIFNTYQYPYNTYQGQGQGPSLPNPTMPVMGYPDQFAPPQHHQPYQSNVGVLSDIEHHLLGEPSHVVSSEAACPYTYTEALYSHHVNCLPPQQTDHDSLLMEHQFANTSLAPFFLPAPNNPTTGDFF